MAATMAWTSDELSTIGAADELQIAPLRQDLRNVVQTIRHTPDSGWLWGQHRTQRQIALRAGLILWATVLV